MRRLLLVMLGACTLGGTGKPPGGDDDTMTGVDNAKCMQAMATAPLAPSGFDYHDSLATATHNTWDAVTMPQPGDAAYPGGKYRTITADTTGTIHPGCSTAGLMYTPRRRSPAICAPRGNSISRRASPRTRRSRS